MVSQEKWVRMHLFLSVLAHYVEWRLRRVLALLLFQDENLDAIAAHNPVAVSMPSAAVRRKKAHGTVSDGLPLHSFFTLMARLATRYRLKADPDASVFDRDTEPTPLQRRALELVRPFPVNLTL